MNEQACLEGLSDQVIGAFIQNARKFPETYISMEKSTWIENILLSTEIRDDDSVHLSNAVVCADCFAELCGCSVLNFF